jgi:hypothetical protein
LFGRLASLPELTNDRIRSAILSERSRPSFLTDVYDFAVYLHRRDFRGITSEFPELFEALNADVTRLRTLVSDGTLELPAFVPLVREGDCADPRCIKFGGCVPHDPIGYPQCPICDVAAAHVVTIYVPMLPEPLQDLFPQDERETVIVVCYCEQCFREVPVFVFRREEIDQLVVSIGNPGRRTPFNEPRMVIGWRMEKSHPDPVGLDAVNIPGMNYRPSRVWGDVIEEKLERCAQGTYFGGFPEYVHYVEQPTPTSRLLLEITQSKASTAMWGDCGTAQLWMEVGENYGKFQVTWACS